MDPKNYSLYWLLLLFLLFSSLLSGQRPDVVFLNDSSKIAGEIEMLETEGPTIIYLITDTNRQKLTASEVSKFQQYDRKTGKQRLEAISLIASNETSAAFYELVSKPESRFEVYQKINKPEYYLVQNGGELVRIPDSEEEFLAFTRRIIGDKNPAINSHKIKTLSPQKFTRLTNYLESNARRFPARSVGFSFSYYRISANGLTAGVLPNTTTLERITADHTPLSTFSIMFTAPEVITGKEFVADAFVILPLSRSGKVDLRVSGGYGYRELAGLQETKSVATNLDINIISVFTGRVHLARFGSKLNYRMGGKKLFPFLSLGIGVEAPVDQEGILYNYLEIGEAVNTNLLHLEPFETTFYYPPTPLD